MQPGFIGISAPYNKRYMGTDITFFLYRKKKFYESSPEGHIFYYKN